MKKIIFAVLVFLINSAALGQVRPVDEGPKPPPRKPAAPASFEARYEGGMLGFSDKETGTLKFDDANERIVFFGKDGKERFSIAFDLMLVIYPQSQSVTSTAGSVVRHIPLPGAGLAGFIKEKRRFLIIHYDDPDADIRGAINFKIENKELLDSVIQTLGEKAKMTQRGDAYYRPRRAGG